MYARDKWLKDRSYGELLITVAIGICLLSTGNSGNSIQTLENNNVNPFVLLSRAFSVQVLVKPIFLVSAIPIKFVKLTVVWWNRGTLICSSLFQAISHNLALLAR